MQNAEAGPSHAPMPGPAFNPSKHVYNRLGIDTLYQEDDMEIDNSEFLRSSNIFASKLDLQYFVHLSGGTVNNVNGSIQNQVLNHHYHGAPPVTSLNPMHSLSPLINDAPIDRILPCFMGREDDIQAIASAVAVGSFGGDAPSRYAVWGMPGLGKSQLALSYAHSSYKAARHTHVIWISATTLEKVNQGFAKVLDLTQHTDRSNAEHGARLTAARLCLERSDPQLRWLIILDDVTVATVSFLREHLPRQNVHGSILITTRTLDLADALTSVAGQQYPFRELKALSPEQSAKLLLKRAGIHCSDLDSAQKLVKRIGCLPLAVEQAGAYIKRSGLTGVGQLETLYDQQGLKEVISWDNSVSTYEEKSVLTTITIQFQRLDEIDPHLLRLLRVLAFFDTESIPLDIIVLGARRVGHRLRDSEVSKSTVSPNPKPKCSLLHEWTGQVSSLRNWSTDALPNPDGDVTSADVSIELGPLLGFICSETWLRGALRHLEDLSLARPFYGEITSLHIHDLIQLVLQQKTVHDPLVEDPYCALAVTLLCGAFETIEDVESPQYWTECERFVPHLMSFAKRRTQTIDFLAMSGQVAWYFYTRGRYEEGEALCQQTLVGQDQQLGADHRQTLHTVNRLATLYRAQGVYDKAATLYRRALAGREQRLGADHPDTMRTVNSLALLYEQQGRYNEAEALYHRALGAQERQLGADHPDTLLTVNDLAILYEQRGRFDEAETLYKRALGGQERQLGVDHLDTLRTVHNLAMRYCQQGRYDEAEKLYQRALAGWKRQVGADHPDTLGTIHNLAMMSWQRGQYDEAETMYQQALAGKEQQLGGDHPDTLRTVHGLALLYECQGNYDKAETLYHRALEGQERQLGLNHPHTLNTAHNLATLYRQQGWYDEAEILYQRALEGQEQQLGANHLDTLLTANNLAKLRVQQGRYQEAETLYNQALTGREKTIGICHPHTLGTIKAFAQLYDQLGRFQEAQIVRDKALNRTD